MVCTGNLYRSPWAAVMLRSRFESLTPGRFIVSSSGTRAIDGTPAPEEMMELAAGWGLSLDTFRARRLDAAQIFESDLILTMELSHRADVLSLDSRALGRTFTLREFARILPSIPVPPSVDPVSTWQSLVACAPRYRSAPEDGSEVDEVIDPWGRWQSRGDVMSFQVERAVETMMNWEQWTRR